LGSSHSPLDESFSEGLLEYPQYTRPEVYRDMKVPEVLLSGNHREIARFRRRQALIRTFEKRPDLIKKAELSEEEKELLRRLKNREDIE
jgi:tRNA (guanine37-N1)-methyltransferase